MNINKKPRFLQILILLIDSIIIFFVLIFLIVISITEGRFYNIPNEYIGIFAYLFLYTLGKIFIGFIIFILLFIKHRNGFIKTSLDISIPWIIFTAPILCYNVLLIKDNIYLQEEILIYSIIVIIGTLIWNKVLLYKIELKRKIMILYTVFSALNNYLMIIIQHFLASI
jgi:hypothetical protein